MIDFDTALALLAEAAAPLGAETVPLAEAVGRVLAEPLHARGASPRYSVSARDGYAVSAAALRAGARYRMVGEARPGAPCAVAIEGDEAARIFTGAALPAGADWVVMQEYARSEGDCVSFAEGHGPGGHVRPAGSDFAAGALLVPAGTRLGARALVAAAAADVAEVRAALRPRVALIASGDELAAPGAAHTRSHAIPDSASLGVAALAEAEGAQIVRRALVADDLERLRAEAGLALAAADVVVAIGGASVGDRDFARPMFAAHGLEALFEKVAIKPGRPVWLGRAQGRLVLGLPGNPTSALVTAALFLRPLLRGLQGARSAASWQRQMLAAALPATGVRETFARASATSAGLLPIANQDSGAQAALLESDWLIRCRPGQPALPPGALVDALPF